MVLVIPALTVVGCARSADTACGTVDRVPIAVEKQRCESGQPGVRWYPPLDDIDDQDDVAVVGQPLPNDYLEYEKEKRTTTRATAPPTTTTTVQPKPTPTTTKKAAAKTTTRSR